jgi:hypothetical protein
MVTDHAIAAGGAERSSPLVFLSSVLRGDRVASIDDVRARIYEYGTRCYGKNAVWVDEKCCDTDTLVTPAFDSVDRLLREIDRSRLYLVLVGTDWAGTNIQVVAGATSFVSFFEIEMFYAALRGRPIVIVERADVKPALRTAEMIALIRRIIPSSSWYSVGSRSEAESLCKFFIDRAASGELRDLEPAPGLYGALLRGLWRLVEARDGSSSIEWLRGELLSGPERPDLAIVEECLNQAAMAFSFEQRLTRIWIASRQLMGKPWHDPKNVDWLPVWARVLSAWNKAGAWYGLHGHLELGYLAAVNSLASVSKRWRQAHPASLDDPAWDPPFASQASAYYALARRVGSLQLRYRGMRIARSLIDQAAPRGPITTSNVLAIRGSIQMALGGFLAAVSTYEEVARLRVAAGAGDGPIGEALSELGFGLLFTLRFRRGRDSLHEGVELMRRAGYSPGFLVRALNKEALAWQITGHFRRARALRAESAVLAERAAVTRITGYRRPT